MNRKKSRIITTTIVFTLLLVLGKTYIIPRIELQNKYNAATEALNSQEYDFAIQAFTELKDFNNASTMLLESKYKKAINLQSCGSYDEAFSLFAELNKYRDSEKQALTCKYSQAKLLLSSGDFEAAENVLSSLETSSETTELLLECQYQRAKQAFRNRKYSDCLKFFQENTAYKESKEYIYQIASKMQKKKKYSKAKELFYSLGDYKDSQKRYTKNRKYLKYAKFRKGSIYDAPYFIKCSKKQAEKYVKQFYGTWYDTDSGEKIVISEFTRNEREWGIHSMYIIDSPVLVYYYLDAPETLIAEEMPSCEEYDDEFGAHITYDAYKVRNGKPTSEKAYTYCTLTKDQYVSMWERLDAERERQRIAEEQETESNNYGNTDQNSSVDEQALAALASQCIGQAIQMTKYAGNSYEVKELASITSVGGESVYRVSFKVYFPSQLRTDFICVYLRKNYVTGNYEFSKGSTN